MQHTSSVIMYMQDNRRQTPGENRSLKLTQSLCSESHCCEEINLKFDEKIICPEKSPSEAVFGPVHQRSQVIDQLDPSNSRRSKILDVEKNELLPEHVVLRFRGPNCTGCAKKIFKSLNSLSALRGLRTNPILLQAEFDVDTKLLPVSDIIDFVRKATGYACERVTKHWQEIEAIVPDGFEQLVGEGFPAGVKDIVFTSKNTASIQYDAETVGARDLLNTRFGTRLVLAPTRTCDDTTGQLRRTAYLTCLSSILTIPILILSWAPLPAHKVAYGAVSLILASAVQVVVAGPFYKSAFRSLFYAKTIDMVILIVLSTTTAYLVSIVSFIYLVVGTELSIGMNFETSALLVTLIMVGRLMTAYAYQQAVKSASVRSLQPTTAFVVNPSGLSKSDCVEFDIRLLQYGDVFKVEPGSLIVSDGMVVSDLSYVDESLMTGESRWIEKRCGSSVIAGSMNCSGALHVRLIRLPGSNTIDEIANMVDEISFSKPKIQETADRYAGYFVPAIGMAALITLGIWLAIAVSVRHESTRAAILTALPFAISVLVVSCPCAITLAVPTVMVIASGIVAKKGVVIKSASALQAAQSISHVVFDKTGTLTDSNLGVLTEKYMGEPPSFTASLILGLTAESQHPVASTVAKHVGATGFEPARIEHIRTVVGKGIAGIFDGEIVRIGNTKWAGTETHPTVKPLLCQGYTVSCVTKGRELLAVFGLAAALRKDVGIVVSELLRRNIEVSIVSGDDAGAVHQTAQSLSIPLENTKSLCSPAEKQQYVKMIMQDPKNTVLFCGDGTNDAAALAQAHIGVFVSSDSGVAHAAADVILMRPSLGGILTLMSLSQDASRRIAFNFTWSAVYNIIAILFAAGAFADVRLPPEYAGLGEAVSVLPVVVVALLLAWRK